MRPAEIAQLLVRSVEAVAKHLLPNGKREGHEWRCGSVSGETGKSLGVHLHGDKAGIWSDFSTGESGDLLDLWREVKNVSMPEAMAPLRQNSCRLKFLEPFKFEIKMITPKKQYSDEFREQALAKVYNRGDRTIQAIAD
ncbi:MAG: hypothetical protein KGZ58_06005, partial [Ignavibacteriales bacterium]|nr:hypothetical protein [Ignavibacteriales bacterium]